MPKPLIFVIIVMLCFQDHHHHRWLWQSPRSSCFPGVGGDSTQSQTCSRSLWPKKQFRYSFVLMNIVIVVQILIIIIFNFMIITKPNPVQYLNQGFFKAVPPQELWQGLLKEGDHWRDIYDDMHKVNHFHNHCHHDPWSIVAIIKKSKATRTEW